MSFGQQPMMSSEAGGGFALGSAAERRDSAPLVESMAGEAAILNAKRSKSVVPASSILASVAASSPAPTIAPSAARKVLWTRTTKTTRNQRRSNGCADRAT